MLLLCLLLFSEDFKTRTRSGRIPLEGFELWNVFSRTLIIAGSTMMYPLSRLLTHLIIMIWSLGMFCFLSPYIDAENNRSAVLFCVCDILGATIGGSPFIVAVFVALFYTGKSITRAIHQQAEAAKATLSGKTEDMFASYTQNEKVFLFPVLLIVWVVVQVYQKCFTDRIKIAEKNITTKTKVAPASEEKDEDDDDHTTVAQNATEHAEMSANIRQSQLRKKTPFATTKEEILL